MSAERVDAIRARVESGNFHGHAPDDIAFLLAENERLSAVLATEMTDMRLTDTLVENTRLRRERDAARAACVKLRNAMQRLEATGLLLEKGNDGDPQLDAKDFARAVLHELSEEAGT